MMSTIHVIQTHVHVLRVMQLDERRRLLLVARKVLCACS